MHKKLSVLAILTLVMAVALVTASVQAVPLAAPGSIPVGQIGGVTNVTAFVPGAGGGQLYFNVGPRLARVNVSSATPLAPALPPAYGPILPGIPEDIKIANGYIYVALGRNGIAIVDASTLATIATQPLTATNGFASAVAIGTTTTPYQHLYVAAGLPGLIEYSLGSDNKTLTYVQTKAFTSPVRRITDVETHIMPDSSEYLYVSANNFSPTPAGRGGMLKYGITSTSALASPIDTKEQVDVNAFAVTDAYVYAAGDPAFYVLDSVELGTTGLVYSVTLPSAAQNIALRPGNATGYLVDSFGGVDVVNISTPTSPALIVSRRVSPGCGGVTLMWASGVGWPIESTW